jgi:MFS family permease
VAEVVIQDKSIVTTKMPHLMRNFVLGVTNGAAFVFAEALMSADTVLTWFVEQLGGSNFLIGLVGPLRDAGWFLPQLFVSHRLQREPRKLPLYRRVSLVRIAAWFTLAVATFFIKDFRVLLFIFFAAYSINSLASGFAGLSFMDIVAKTIPVHIRGSFFGGRMFFGGMLGLAASALVAAMLARDNTLAFPVNVAVLFGVSWIVAALGLAAFGAIVEPPGEVRDEIGTLSSHVRRAARLPRHNANLRFFLIARIVLFLAYIAVPFYSIYSINVLGAPPSIIGVYVGVRTLISLVINPVWSRLSDRHGNKLVVWLASSCGVLMAAWALLAPLVASGLKIEAGLTAYLFVPLYALMGLYETGIGIGAINLLLEIAPGDDRAIYVGLTNTILGVAYISTITSGLLVDRLGYQGVFAIAALFLIVGWWALSRIREPRNLIDRRPVPNSE